MADIRIDVGFPNHPKTRQMIADLNEEAFRALVTLWTYAAVYKPDGLLDLTPRRIAAAACWPLADADRFVAILIDVGFLDVVDGGYFLHDWQEHQPYIVSAAARHDRAVKAAKARWNTEQSPAVNANSNTGSNASSNAHDLTIPDQTKPHNAPARVKKSGTKGREGGRIPAEPVDLSKVEQAIEYVPTPGLVPGQVDWDKVRAILRARYPGTDIDRWIGALHYEGDVMPDTARSTGSPARPVVVLIAPDTYTAKHITDNYLDRLKEALFDTTDGAYGVSFKVSTLPADKENHG